MKQFISLNHLNLSPRSTNVTKYHNLGSCLKNWDIFFLSVGKLNKCSYTYQQQTRQLVLNKKLYSANFNKLCWQENIWNFVIYQTNCSGFQNFTRLKYKHIPYRSKMGNESCGVSNQIFTLNLTQHTELTKENSTQNKTRTTCSQDAGCENQEIDEGSPFSKFDIKFLKTSVKASNIKIATQNQLSLKSNFNIKSMSSVKSNNKILDIKKSLFQWSQIPATDLSQDKNTSQSQEGETQKLKALQDYANFLLKIEDLTKFEDMKISGENMYKIKKQAISPYYEMRRKIGEGSFGSVYIGKCMKSGQLRAVKVIKKKTMNAEDHKLLISEINILKRMDHINIIKLYDVFYYKNFFYVVTQYCEGGSLLQALRQNKINSEKEVILIMKQVVSAILYMHQMKIAHRDLKLQNIMLVNQTQGADSGELDKRKIIKIIDFGLACTVNYTFRNKSGIVGTIDYMAPQIFLGYFSCNSDVWSCGIIICMLLIGFNPFKKNQMAQTIRAIKQEQIDFKKPHWKKISKKAKDLLVLMLNKRQEKRITIEQVIQNPWFKHIQQKQTSMMDSQMVIRNFNGFNRGNNFICFIKNFLISRELSQGVRQEMALIFQRIDSDSSGVIEKKQLMALYSLVTGVNDELIQRVIDKIDQNHSGRIDFQQFLICMTENQILRNQEYIDRAFDFLDDDRTGYIERKELFECLSGCEQEQFLKILKDVDFDGDGKISREEFRNYLINVQF